ncbi:hypothetical protein E2542_SST22438 [Spatholobus suberectus]|nr:hypothetical protein E2542_SST22438 [Spatholobus suberectus]
MACCDPMDGKGSDSVCKAGGAPGGESNVTKPKEANVGSNSVMKAPGGDGSYISREEFEKNPQGYFADLHAEQKTKK